MFILERQRMRVFLGPRVSNDVVITLFGHYVKITSMYALFLGD